MRQSLSLSEPVVKATAIEKRFGRTQALDGLDLNVRPGEVHGFLGPNGAGKSTTIRAALGMISLTGGELSVFGMHPRRDAVSIHSRLAYVPGDAVLWPSLSGGECIDLMSRLNGRTNPKRRAELIERFDLDPTKRARTYSKGNRQKVALIAALASGAELLILDEPTSGLDPLMEAAFQQTIREARDAGSTVLLSSHILDEVEALCDQVTIIRAGRSAFTGSLQQLRSGTRTTIVATADSPIAGLDAWHPTISTEGDLVRHELVVAPDEMPEAVTRVAQARPATLVVRPPSLDELFLGHYEKDEQ